MPISSQMWICLRENSKRALAPLPSSKLLLWFNLIKVFLLIEVYCLMSFFLLGLSELIMLSCAVREMFPLILRLGSTMLNPSWFYFGLRPRSRVNVRFYATIIL